MYALKHFILLCLIFLALSVLGDESGWKIRFGMYTYDSTYVDDWNYARVITGASREHDIYDMEKLYPPVTSYIIMCFPHREPTEPDYWPPPNNKDYSDDCRPPLTGTEVWHMKFLFVYSGIRTVTVWWTEIDSLPGDYLPLLISPDNDSFNLYAETEFTRSFAAGVQRWEFSVEPGYYNRMSICPGGGILYIGETRDYKAYLHHGADSILSAHVKWEYHGSGGSADENGHFSAISPGGGYMIADIGGMRDSVEITIIPGGTLYEIPLDIGWNLISLPALPHNNRTDIILPGVPSDVYTFEMLSSDFIPVDTLLVGKGYFVLSICDTIYTFAGIPLNTVTTALYLGWNMIGGPGTTVTFSDFSTVPPGIILHPPFTWSGEYKTPDSIGPAQGFWLLSGTNGEITITLD